jgi:hypothetical protein
MMHARSGARAITRRCELNRTGWLMGLWEAFGEIPHGDALQHRGARFSWDKVCIEPIGSVPATGSEF